MRRRGRAAHAKGHQVRAHLGGAVAGALLGARVGARARVAGRVLLEALGQRHVLADALEEGRGVAARVAGHARAGVGVLLLVAVVVAERRRRRARLWDVMYAWRVCIGIGFK